MLIKQRKLQNSSEKYLHSYVSNSLSNFKETPKNIEVQGLNSLATRSVKSCFHTFPLVVLICSRHFQFHALFLKQLPQSSFSFPKT